MLILENFEIRGGWALTIAELHLAAAKPNELRMDEIVILQL